MRSRARLIEVLNSVNANAVGMTVARCLKDAAHMIKTKKGSVNLFTLAEIIIAHESPHIREIADEAEEMIFR